MGESLPRARRTGATRLQTVTQGSELASVEKAIRFIISAMRKTLSDRPKEESPDSAAPRAAQAPPRFVPRGGGEKNRLLIAVSDGKIDFRAMSPETSKLFNELMHSAEVQAQFGFGPFAEHFNPEHCKRFFDAFGRVLQGFGKLALHWPDEALLKLEYTPKEKEELAEPTAKALDELAPRWLRENQAVAAFFLVFATVTQQKLAEAALEARRIHYEKSKAAFDRAQSAPANEASPMNGKTNRQPLQM
jgi:hypothetical protein